MSATRPRALVEQVARKARFCKCGRVGTGVTSPRLRRSGLAREGFARGPVARIAPLLRAKKKRRKAALQFSDLTLGNQATARPISADQRSTVVAGGAYSL